MTSLPSASPTRTRHLKLQRRLRRALVHVRTSPFSVPGLLAVYAVLMIGLSQVADS